MNYAKDFPVLKNNPNLIYFDNAATVLKPQKMIDAESGYLIKNGANAHTKDFKNAILTNELIEDTRLKTARFLNGTNPQEIIFTSGATQGLSQIAFGLKHLLNPGDEILLTSLEHASNLLPWVVVGQQAKAHVKMMPLKKDFTIDCSELEKMINKKTKIIAFAHGSNTIGILNDVPKISALARKINPEVMIVVDAAQSVAHSVIDLQAWDADFVAFSAHKMYGPFGIGVLWGKKPQLEKLTPLIYGGGMNYNISSDLVSYQLNPLPLRLEAGSGNFSGIAGFNATLDYLQAIGMENIQAHEKELKKYAREQVKKLGLTKTIDFYNLDNDAPLLTFNAKKWNAQDIANFLDHKYQIAVRSGAHCARLTGLAYGREASLRVSFALYNTKQEVDTLLKGLQEIDQFLDVFF